MRNKKCTRAAGARMAKGVMVTAAVLCATYSVQAISESDGPKTTRCKPESHAPDVSTSCVSEPSASQASQTQAITLQPVFVSATLNPRPQSEVPYSTEVIDGKVLEKTVGNTFIDKLKKNASVDVIHYPNSLAGVGLRGMRPDFHFSTSPSTLLLINGRPAGTTSLTTLSPQLIERIEIVKGPSSARYGASAVGGVINIILRKSQGPIDGTVSLGYGSFDTRRAELVLGGSLTDRTDFDLAIGYVNQNDNFVTGSGEEQFNSSFRRISTRLRVGADLTRRLRIDATIGWTDVSNNSPGPVSNDPPEPSDIETSHLGGDVQLALTLPYHKITATAYATKEEYYSFEVPRDAPRYKSYGTEWNYFGLQAQDVWTLTSNMSLTYGIDWNRIEAENASWNASGERDAPYSPNEYREGLGVYAEWGSHWLHDHLILTLGARVDWIEAGTLPTPYKNNFTADSGHYTTFNPRGGVVYKLTDRWRLHASAGTGFVPPEGSQLAGKSVEYVGNQRHVTIGNKDLEPVHAVSWDAGFGYSGRLATFDLTYFNMRLANRIRSVIVKDTPEETITTYKNADESRISGVEGRFGFRLGHWFGLPTDRVRFDGGFTYMIRAEDLGSNGSKPIHNIAEFKTNLSLTVNNGDNLAGTVTVRRVGTRYDIDYSEGRIYTNGNGGLFPYDEFTVVDLSVRWQVTNHHQLRFNVSNLLDEYYYEKADYIMPGRAFSIRYTYEFGGI